MKQRKSESIFIAQKKSSSEVHERPQEGVLLNAAQILASALREVKGIQTCQVTAAEAEEMVPDVLYMFLRWIFDEAARKDANPIRMHSDKERLHRRILSVAQDMIFIDSNGSKDTPKHVGMAISLRHLTGSRTAISMLNQLGHLSSYEKTERIDTAIAESIIAKAEEDGVVLPTNIRPGVFVQAAGDNLDFCEETLDGKQATHETSSVFYQRNENLSGSFSTLEEITGERVKKVRKCSVPNVSLFEMPGETIHFARTSQPPIPFRFKQKWFTLQFKNFDSALKFDMAYILVKLCPTKLFEVNLLKEPLDNSLKTAPGWSGTNALLCQTEVQVTTIGYCPMLPKPPTDYNTIFTLLTTFQKQMRKLDQSYTVVTFDQKYIALLKKFNGNTQMCLMIWLLDWEECTFY